MADEISESPAVAVVAEPQANTAAVEDDKPAKDTRSFEERIAALKKPVPMTQPDEEKVQKDLAALHEKIDKCDKRMVN